MRRYIVTGAPGAGKTTLLAALADRGYEVVPEAATDVIARQQANGVSEPWTQARFLTDILHEQVARQLRETSAPVVLFDRSPVCTLALARFLGHPVPPELTDEVDRRVADGIYEREVFLVRPLGFIEPTAARRISYEDALAFEVVHRSTYEEHGFTLVEVPADPVPTRAAAVHDAIVALDPQRTEEPVMDGDGIARCVCGIVGPIESGPVHAYVPASAHCWRLFGEVQAEEMQRFGYPPAHRPLVDAYMASHPGDGADRRDRQSVVVHLVSLCGVLERGWTSSTALAALRRSVSKTTEFPLLSLPTAPPALNVTSMVASADAADYDRRAQLWAASVWHAWAAEHDRIRSYLDG